MECSLIDLAFKYVKQQKGISKFADIWNYVSKEAGLTQEEADQKISRFYTNIMLDGRFVTLGKNEWDLRERHTFDKVHIDMKDVYSDVETSDNDSEEAQEENDYNAVFEEKVPTENPDNLIIDGNEIESENTEDNFSSDGSSDSL